MPGSHVVLTGPIKGLLTLADGTVVNVSPDRIEVDSLEKAQEVAFLIGEHWVENGHPDDIDIEVDDDGNEVPVQRPFFHDCDDKFEDHPGKCTAEPAGVPIDEKG